MKTNLYKVLLMTTILALLLGACRPVTPQPPAPSEPPAQPTRAGEKTTAPPALPAATEEPTAKPPTPTQPGLQAADPGTPLPPQVVDQQPQDAGELPQGGSVVLTFDQPMDPGATAAALQVVTPQGKPVQGKVQWADQRTLQFAPSAKLESGTLYFASLDVSAKSAAGVALPEPYTFEFQAAGDLQVSQVFPAPGAQDVDSKAVITVIFNRPVVPLVISEETGDLPNPLSISPELPGKGEWVNTSVYAFRPEKGYLQSGVTYQATVRAGLQDASGQSSLAQDYTWQFSTSRPRIDFFTLSDRLYNPDNGFNKALLDDYFVVRFLQPMDHPSTEAAIAITGGPAVGLEYDWSDDSLGVTITPTTRLALGTSYVFQIGQGAQAANGGRLSDGLEWSFTTIPLPAVAHTTPRDGTTQDAYSSSFEIQFVSPMRIDTIKDHVQVTPKPKDEIEWYYNEWDWTITGWFLQPATEYEVRLLPGMQDIYGNTIDKEQVVRFTTAHKGASASLLMPYDISVLRAEGPEEAQEFYIDYTNVKQVDLTLGRLEAEQVMAFQNGEQNAYSYRIPQQQVVWQAREPGGPIPDQRTVKPFRPQVNGAPLPTGFYFLALDSPSLSHSDPYADHRRLVVANASLTLKTSATEALAWLTDMETGEPISGAPVGFYSWEGELLKEVVTDGQGLAYAELPEPADSYEQRFAIVDDGKNLAYAQSQWGSGVSLYDYGIWTDYYSKAYQPRAYLYTERPIYRPGQPVYFKGIVRIDNDLDYRLPAQSQVKLEISNYQGSVTSLELPLSAMGTFNGEFRLDPGAALGYYTMDVRLGDSEESIGSITFNVAEYRKPEFQVDVSASPENLLANASFTVQVQADYYSGGGVSGAAVQWTLTAETFTFQPPDEFSGYSFQDYEDDVYYYDREGGNGSRTMAEGTGQTGPDGRFTISQPASLGEDGQSQRLTFEATLTDIAQTAVSGRTSVVAHRSQVYPGVRAQTYVGQEGKEQTFELAALDWDGQPLAGQALSVEIVERRWYSVQEQDPSGRVTWKTSVEEVPLTTLEVTTGSQGKAQAVYTPPKGGIYRARVTALDSQGNAGKASAYQWVAGREYIPWRQSNDRSFELVTDKRGYQPGETAQVLIASPFQGEAYALVTVERGRIRHEEVVPLDSNSTIYKLRITPDMAPNAYISVVVVKGVDNTNPRPNFKTGFTEIEVDIHQKQLQVEVTPDRTQAGPGEQVSYSVRTLDDAGQPVPAEVSLSLSDLATLSLLPPNSTPASEYFYSRRNLSVWTAVSLVQNIDEYNQDIRDEVQQGENAGGGGGKGEGDLGVVEVRQDFPDTAFWDAMVQTDSGGTATVVVTLPDNLTTWRMEARAVADGTRVGQTTSDIISTRPLLVRPQTPRFFVVNDQARLGAAVHNNTGQSLEVQVALQAEGLEVSGPLSQTVSIAAGQKAFVTWDVTAQPDAERVDLIFSAQGGDYKDASRAPQGTLDNQGLPVYRYEAPETVGTSGQLLEANTAVEGIRLPQSMSAGSGTLTIRLQPSLAAGITDGLTYLKGYPYECAEQTVSRFLPNVLSTQAMRAAGINDPELAAGLQEQVDAAMQRLYSLQNPDGGWGWWGEEKSNPLVSAYVILGLVEASQAGYTINQDVLARGLNFLRLQVEPLTGLKDPLKLNRQAFILYVLARSGAPDVSSTVQLYDQRQRMHLYSQAFLAHALYWIDPGDSRVQTLLSDLASQAVTSATGTHWEEKSEDRWNWNTDTRTTAIVLSALSEIDGRNPLNANAVRWLMSHRTDGHWLGTQETAWTLMALTRWMSLSGELQANYQYAVGLNGTTLASGQASRDTLRDTLELKVDIKDMLQDELNRLAFTRDGGPGNLYYTAHLNVTLPVEQIEPLDRGIAVSRSYYTLEDLQTPVTEAKQGDLLLARLTLVAPHDLHYLVVDDPLPAGLEGVDQSLSTSPQSVEVPQQYSWEDMFWRGWGWWSFDHIQYKDEKVVLSATHLPAGTYVYTYLVRAGTPGSFRVTPVTAQEFYFPEVYGRGEGSLFTVQP